MQQRSQTTINGLTKDLQGHKQTIKQLETAAESQDKTVSKQQQQIITQAHEISALKSDLAGALAALSSPAAGVLSSIAVLPR
jgi:predicted  nucleic acid-binding Zn-ribbon protein